MTLLLVAAAVLPIRGQALAPPIDVIVDGGILGGGPTDGRPAEGVPTHVTWSGGLTARSRRVSLGRSWDFSGDAALRREPAFALGRSAATVAPAYFDALTVSTTIQFAHGSRAFETAVVGRFAETRLDRAQRVMRATNTIDDWAFLVDVVVDVRWFGPGNTPTSEPNRWRSSTVRGYVGVQHNQRLHRAGDLQRFDDPTGRVVGGIYVTPWQRRNVRGQRVMAAGGGMDIETAIRRGERLPAGFRVLVRAEVDVHRALQAWR
jgi:hypothetical protein